MSAQVSLNLLNKFSKSGKMRGSNAFCRFLAMSLINSIIQEHKC